MSKVCRGKKIKSLQFGYQKSASQSKRNSENRNWNSWSCTSSFILTGNLKEVGTSMNFSPTLCPSFLHLDTVNTYLAHYCYLLLVSVVLRIVWEVSRVKQELNSTKAEERKWIPLFGSHAKTCDLNANQLNDRRNFGTGRRHLDVNFTKTPFCPHLLCNSCNCGGFQQPGWSELD